LTIITRDAKYDIIITPYALYWSLKPKGEHYTHQQRDRLDISSGTWLLTYDFYLNIVDNDDLMMIMVDTTPGVPSTFIDPNDKLERLEDTVNNERGTVSE
jgi:hypothetical protein